MPYSLIITLLLSAFPTASNAPFTIGGDIETAGIYNLYCIKNQALIHRLNDAPSCANYDTARHIWEQISWLQPVLPLGADAPVIDNSHHWVSPDKTEDIYPEAGAWQLLEAETRRITPDATSVERQTAVIIAYLQALEADLSRHELSLNEIRFLLATEVYRQYTLTLSGHYRLDPDRAVTDFSAFLTGLKEWNAHFDLTDQAGYDHLIAAISFCQGVEFECLDRYTLYRNHLRPLYLSLLQGVPVEILARKYKVAANPGGELFSTAFIDPVTIRYSTATAELGRLLFFDPWLSGNGRRSCASCHQPRRAYTDGRITSMAFDYPNRIDRNAPSLINNTTGYGACGADLAKESVGYFIQSVFDHPQEMNVRMDSIVNRLNKAAGYRNAFANAFPSGGVDSANVITALAAFITNLKGVTASFDREIRAPDTPTDSAAIRGYNLFAGKGNCGNCHFPPYFDGRKPPYYRERGYQSVGRLTHLRDLGMGAILKDNRYDYFFRITGVRNLSYSPPYGHDGYFITLRSFTEDHHGAEQLNSAEMADLLHFMSSLNDSLSLIDETEINLPHIDNQITTTNRRPAGLY